MNQYQDAALAGFFDSLGQSLRYYQERQDKDAEARREEEKAERLRQIAKQEREDLLRLQKRMEAPKRETEKGVEDPETKQRYDVTYETAFDPEQDKEVRKEIRRQPSEKKLHYQSVPRGGRVFAIDETSDDGNVVAQYEGPEWTSRGLAGDPTNRPRLVSDGDRQFLGTQVGTNAEGRPIYKPVMVEGDDGKAHPAGGKRWKPTTDKKPYTAADLRQASEEAMKDIEATTDLTDPEIQAAAKDAGVEFKKTPAGKTLWFFDSGGKDVPLTPLQKRALADAIAKRRLAGGEKKPDADETKKVDAVPPGYRLVGYSKGRPVYEDARGNRFVEE